jgi:DNA repair exonuclease SbcCD ATPase subunit
MKNNLLRPKKLVLEGFRSFAKKAEIEFPDSGAVLISGKYKDGTTSSGSGKSSILIGMAYALGISSIPATKLKNWDSKKIFVELTLTDGTNVYEISRSPALKLIQNGVEYKGTPTGAQEILNMEILKTSPELVKALTYRPQRTAGKFITLTDSKVKEFLGNLLGLDEIEAAHTELEQEAKQLFMQETTLENNIKFAEDTLKATTVTEESVAEAEKAFSEADKALQLVSNTAEEEALWNQRSIQAQTEINKINQAQNGSYQLKVENDRYKTEIEKLQHLIKIVEDNICPTCNREWDQGQDQIDKYNVTITDFVSGAKHNLEQLRQYEPLLKPEYKTQMSLALEGAQTKLALLKSPIASAQATRNATKMTLETLKAETNKCVVMVQKIRSQQTELVQVQKDRYAAHHAATLLSRSGFLGSIFDEVLQDIASRTNDLMSFIPNVNTFSIGISSEKVTKAGKVNKKIDISLHKDGKSTSYDILSGGQKTSAELCSDLAVSESIRSRSGSNLGWVALDEAMDGLGPETKMEALEVIKAKVNGLILVVDHSTEIKEAFDQIIEVEFDGKESYIV